MTFESIDSWWWPYVFILLAGWLPTDMFRFAGILSSSRIKPDSEALQLVRAVATAVVAAVIARLVLFPSGDLADTSTLLRVVAAAIGFAVFLGAGNRVLAGLVAAEAALFSGYYAGF